MTWKPFTGSTCLPAGRTVILRAKNIPAGAFDKATGYTLFLGQVGTGNQPGVWTQVGFFPDQRRIDGPWFDEWSRLPGDEE